MTNKNHCITRTKKVAEASFFIFLEGKPANSCTYGASNKGGYFDVVNQHLINDFNDHNITSNIAFNVSIFIIPKTVRYARH